MVCNQPKPVYLAHSRAGISGAYTRGDGYEIALDWVQAYPSQSPYRVLYNIYYSTVLKDVLTEGVKLVSIQDGYLTASVYELPPGDTFYFAVRATEIDPSYYLPEELPQASGIRIYPETLLTADISSSSLVIPISDIDQFPSLGIIQIGYELIQYSSKLGNNLIVGAGGRGFLGTNARPHSAIGFDGELLHDPIIKFWKGFEEANEVIAQASSKFAYPNYSRTDAAGYRTIQKDNFNTHLSGSDGTVVDGGTSVLDSPSDVSQGDFPSYDYTGWRRTDPISLLNGECVGTYIGGELFCADGYNGVGGQLRGISINDENTRRQEVLLESTGEPVILLRRMYQGITCKCIEQNSMNPSLRCAVCFATGFVRGYEQYFNTRRSDSKIMVRFGPTDDEVKIEDEGLESSFLPDCWTLVVPALKSRDIIIRFNEDGTEEFRYEVMSVNRNKLLNTISGGQKFKLQRIRRTDPVYQFPVFKDTSTMPQVLSTSIGMETGIAPHVHTFVVSENITSLSQINQVTNISAGHSHVIRNGAVYPGKSTDGSLDLAHTHTIIFP